MWVHFPYITQRICLLFRGIIMKNLLTTLLVIFAILYVASAEIPQKISYQGLLQNGSGQTVVDGDYTLTFKLYSTQSSETTLWEETQVVNVINGIFNVFLGTTVPLGADDLGLWLGIQIDSEDELSPRTELT